jgi:hypothetical protein
MRLPEIFFLGKPPARWFHGTTHSLLFPFNWGRPVLTQSSQTDNACPAEVIQEGGLGEWRGDREDLKGGST